MSEFRESELEKLSRLCHIELSPEEKKELASRLTKVLDYVTLLNEVDTSGVELSSYAHESTSILLREDAVGELLDRDTFLKNAPDHVAGMIKVPPVLKHQNS